MIQAKAFWRNYNLLIVFAFFSFIALALLIDNKAMGYDASLFIKWAQAIKNNGLSLIYQAEIKVDYLPGFLYVLNVYTWFVGNVNDIPNTIYYVKIVPLFFEILALFVMCTYFKDKFQQLFFFLIGAFNVAYFYNTMVWFQIDGWVASMMFFSILAAISGRLFFSIILFIVAINIKFQAIIILPVIGLYWLSQIKSLKQFFQVLIIVILTEGVVLSPFLFNGSVKVVFQNVFNTYDLFPYVSLNARNFWMLVEDNPRFLSDTNVFLIFSYKTWGLMLFLLSSLVLIIPLVLFFLKRQIPINTTHQIVLLSCLLSCFFFFYFNTQMHERYIHYAFPFVMFYSFKYQTLGLYLVFSVACFFNLESLLFNFNYWEANSVWVSHRFITILFSFVVVLYSFKWIQLVKDNLSLRIDKK